MAAYFRIGRRLDAPTREAVILPDINNRPIVLVNQFIQYSMVFGELKTNKMLQHQPQP